MVQERANQGAINTKVTLVPNCTVCFSVYHLKQISKTLQNSLKFVGMLFHQRLMRIYTYGCFKKVLRKFSLRNKLQSYVLNTPVFGKDKKINRQKNLTNESSTTEIRQHCVRLFSTCTFTFNVVLKSFRGHNLRHTILGLKLLPQK